jgi:hypothetical protein
MAKTKTPKVQQNISNQQAQALNQTQQNLLADFQEGNAPLGVLETWLIKEIAEAMHWINRLQASKRESFWDAMRAYLAERYLFKQKLSNLESEEAIVALVRAFRTWQESKDTQALKTLLQDPNLSMAYVEDQVLNSKDFLERMQLLDQRIASQHALLRQLQRTLYSANLQPLVKEKLQAHIQHLKLSNQVGEHDEQG